MVQHFQNIFFNFCFGALNFFPQWIYCLSKKKKKKNHPALPRIKWNKELNPAIWRKLIIYALILLSWGNSKNHMNMQNLTHIWYNMLFTRPIPSMWNSNYIMAGEFQFLYLFHYVLSSPFSFFFYLPFLLHLSLNQYLYSHHLRIFAAVNCYCERKYRTSSWLHYFTFILYLHQLFLRKYY